MLLYRETMQKQVRRIEWDIFWFREVLFLGAPVLIAVFTLPRGDTIHTVRLAVLLLILLGLTLLNMIWASFHRLPREASRAHRTP